MQNITKKLRQAINHNGTKPPITNLRNIVMPNEFNNYLKFIADVGAGISVSTLVTSTNYDAIRESWLHTKNFDPTFNHNKELLETAFEQIADAHVLLWPEFRDISDAQRRLFITLANNRARDLAATGELAEAIYRDDARHGNRILERKYGELQSDTIFTAQALASSIQKTDFVPGPAHLTVHEQECLALITFDTLEIKFWLEWSLENYGFNVPVIINSHVDQITVENNTRYGLTIFVPGNITLTGIDLLRTNLSKIECRVRTYLNSKELFRPHGGKISLGYVDNDVVTKGLISVKLEEFNQNYLGIQSPVAPWHVLALNSATHERCGFLETAAFLAEQITSTQGAGQSANDPWEDAFDYAYDVFRIGSDTHNPKGDNELFVFTGSKNRLEGNALANDLIRHGLGHWLELGGFSPEELVQIANVVNFTPEMIPHRFKDTTSALCRIFLADE